jgi:nucleoside-diphosphate-sugar epimerase
MRFARGGQSRYQVASMTLRFLVTGGRGFVGKAVVSTASSKGLFVRASSRQAKETLLDEPKYCQVGALGPDTDWDDALDGVEVVVHCAGRAHVINDKSPDPAALFRVANLEGTLHLARRSANAGVKRFVFLSSIGVNGAETRAGDAFSENDPPRPHNAYALSKWEAEQGLTKIAAASGMEIVVIRPPLVYGYDAPGNFGALARAVGRGFPLPLGAINNRRSLIGLDNLVDFILTCAVHPKAANETFLVSDGDDMSTTKMVREIATAAGRDAVLLPVPGAVLRLGAALVGRASTAQSLVGSLEINITKARTQLGWNPPFTVAEGFKRALLGHK